MNLPHPEPTPTVTDEQIIEAMLSYGGSFAKALARAWQAADSDNRSRIKTTWPGYWVLYTKFAISGTTLR
jgi:hypothetical protein